MDKLFWSIFWRNKLREIKDFLMWFLLPVVVCGAIGCGLILLEWLVALVVVVMVCFAVILVDWIQANVEQARDEAREARKKEDDND